MYDTYQLGRLAAAPLNLWAAGLRTFWSAAPWGWTPGARAAAAGAELLERATRHYPKPAWGLAHDTVLRTPFCDLLRFGGGGPAVLLVAPLSGHHATLLRDTVATLAPEHTVYITDWIDARLVPLAAGGFDLDDYIDLLRRFLGHIGPGANLVAVCQPAVAALAVTALMGEDVDPARPRSLTLMGGPVDTRLSPTTPDELAQRHPLAWFERTLVHRVPAGEPGAGRRVYPGFLQLGGFVAMNPDRHLEAHLRLFGDVVAGDEAEAAATRRFYDEYLAVMDMPAEYYLQTVAAVFQRHDLPRGALRHRGRRVDLAAIRDTALFTVEGEKDDITGAGQCHAAHALCPNVPARRRHTQPGAGHYGIFSGHRFREQIAPLLRDFFRD